MIVSIIVPTRKRPEQLKRLLASIDNTAVAPPLVEIILGVDADDHETLAVLKDLHTKVKVVAKVADAAPTLGELENRLAKFATGDAIGILADDMILTTKGWDGEIRKYTWMIPDRLGLMFFNDPSHPGFPTYPVVTRTWYETLGYLVPHWFPFWWGDTWLDELGILVNRKYQLPCDIAEQEGRGHTNNIRDVAWWAEFFNETRELRLADADKILSVMRKPITHYFDLRTKILMDPANAKAWEERLGTNQPPSPRYLAAKARAQAQLERMKSKRNAA